MSTNQSHPENLEDAAAARLPLSGSEAVERAAARAAQTSDKNISLLPDLPGLPVAEDTANLRLGPNLHDGLLALLPLVGVWRGTGQGSWQVVAPGSQHSPERQGDFSFEQQLIVSHNGDNYLQWQSRIWSVDEQGQPSGLDLRESGFWRISLQDEIEFTLTSSEGLVSIYYGEPLNERAWQLESGATLVTTTGPAELGPGKRLYGLMPTGELGWVEEVQCNGELRPRFSGQLTRVVG